MPAPAMVSTSLMTSNAVPTSRGFSWSRIAAVLYDPFLALGEARGMAGMRRDLLRAATGRVLEIGAGTGRNLPAYPDGVASIVLTEPDPAMRARLDKRIARSDRPATVLAAGAESIPVDDASIDTVVSTMVLCTVDHPEPAMAEIARVLAPGGRLLFIEHVRSDEPRLAARQDRYESAWRGFAIGCRCNRPTLAMLNARFTDVRHKSATWRGMPSIVHPLVIGEATSPITRASEPG